jgi:UDP-N-acetylglucosamine--N-acetylmuramyl-(pentapeptide) pyrophosphoryl-undecaprenol N-acetylglucosamine transferase
MMKITIVSGGTGGHIYPGIAVADEIKKRDPQAEIVFLGSKDGLEKELVGKAGYKIKLIRSRALLRKISYKAISAPFVMFVGFFQAIFFLKKFSPDILVSTGGYASLPAVAAAKLLRIPTILLEQNVLPGAVNRICKRFSNKVFISFEETKKYMQGEVVGNPVREEIKKADRNLSRKKLGLDQNARVILIMGGSQGSKKINEAVISAADKLPSGVQVLHIIGERDYQWIESTINREELSNYFPIAYLHQEIANAIAASNLVISRAGATAIAEFVVLGIPMVLIPFPYAAENHQKLNAQVMVDGGAAIMVEDKDFDSEKFLSLITDSSLDYDKMSKASLSFAKPDAAKRIVDYIYG